MVPWSLVMFDEAHKLRNVYRAAETSRAAILRDALAGRQKLRLIATPLQNNLMELYGLISIIDETYFGSKQAFRAEFGGREEVASQALLARRLELICKRTLRRQVQKIGLINYTNRHPKTFDFTPDRLETDLYDLVSAWLMHAGHGFDEGRFARAMSPKRQWHSPARTSKDTPFSAITLPKCFSILSSLMMGSDISVLPSHVCGWHC